MFPLKISTVLVMMPVEHAEVITGISFSVQVRTIVNKHSE